MYRLYVDEVGTDDLTHLDDDNNRYLSLTGVAMKITVARDDLGPRLDAIKAKSLRTVRTNRNFSSTDIVGLLNDEVGQALMDYTIKNGLSDRGALTKLLEQALKANGYLKESEAP